MNLLFNIFSLETVSPHVGRMFQIQLWKIQMLDLQAIPQVAPLYQTTPRDKTVVSLYIHSQRICPPNSTITPNKHCNFLEVNFSSFSFWTNKETVLIIMTYLHLYFIQYNFCLPIHMYILLFSLFFSELQDTNLYGLLLHILLHSGFWFGLPANHWQMRGQKQY